MGAAEDGNPSHYRPQAAGAESDDAVDDATNVWLPQFIIPQRSGSLLGGIKCYQHCYAVFCYRLGSSGASLGYKAGYQG